MVEFYQMALTDEDQFVWKNAFYNLPYFYDEFTSSFNFKNIFEEVTSKDENIEILRILAASIHHIFKTADKQDPESKPVLWKLVDKLLESTDPDILYCMSENLHEIMPMISTFIWEDEPPEQSPHSSTSDTNFGQSAEAAMKNGGAKIKRKQSDIISDKSGESLTEEEIIENSYMSFLNKLMIYEEHIWGYNYWW